VSAETGHPQAHVPAALREHLLAHSVKRGQFTLKSGRTSTWFIDSKQTVCRPEAMLLVADAVLGLVPAEATAIGGLIAGALDPGDRVVIAEDTVTRGTSLLEAAHAVQEAGAEVVRLVAVVDRGGTVKAMAAAEGLPFRAVLTAPDLGFPYEGG